MRSDKPVRARLTKLADLLECLDVGDEIMLPGYLDREVKMIATRTETKLQTENLIAVNSRSQTCERIVRVRRTK